MADTTKKSAIWKRRERLGLARERIAALLDPPIASKTLERWEKGVSPLPEWRRKQLIDVYDQHDRRAA